MSETTTPTSGGQEATDVALVGCAHIHVKGVVEMLKSRPDVRVRWVWDHDAERARRWAEELGGESAGVRVADDVAVVWKDKGVTAAFVYSETDRHHTLVMAAAKAKKHLFVEKPLGMGSKDAYAMAAAVEKAGVRFQTGYYRRGDPNVLFLRDALHRGLLGKITRARASNCHGGALAGWFDAEHRWMADPAVAGVGAFGDMGAHSLDVLLFLLGEVAECTAMLSPGTGRYEGCDEGGEGLLRFTNGVVGTIAAGWSDVANPVSLLVAGTEGHAMVLNEQLYLQSSKIDGADGKQPWEKTPAKQPSRLDLFLDALAGGDPHAPLVTAREAAYRNAVMEAMYEGARKGKWAKPKPFPTPKSRARAARAEPQEMVPPASATE